MRGANYRYRAGDVTRDTQHLADADGLPSEKVSPVRRRVHPATRVMLRLLAMSGYDNIRTWCQANGLGRSTVCRLVAGLPIRRSNHARIARALTITPEELDAVLARGRE